MRYWCDLENAEERSEKICGGMIATIVRAIYPNEVCVDGVTEGETRQGHCDTVNLVERK